MFKNHNNPLNEFSRHFTVENSNPGKYLNPLVYLKNTNIKFRAIFRDLFASFLFIYLWKIAFHSAFEIQLKLAERKTFATSYIAIFELYGLERHTNYKHFKKLNIYSYHNWCNIFLYMSCIINFPVRLYHGFGVFFFVFMSSFKIQFCIIIHNTEELFYT